MKKTENEVITYKDKTRYTSEPKNKIKNKENYQTIPYNVEEIRNDILLTQIKSAPRHINQIPGLI